jgi:ABC-2 type transport system permease protein
MNALLPLWWEESVSRIRAMVIKEWIEFRRDKVTFATIIIVPLIQLILFGFAINTNPRHLPTAVFMEEASDVARSILSAIKNTAYFSFTKIVTSEKELDDAITSGEVLFGIQIPFGFERALRRGEAPALFLAADATDPVASEAALSAVQGIGPYALAYDRGLPLMQANQKPLFEIRTHARYNPTAVTQLNIVPGLLGTILTMTLLIYTALSVTRERERGTMECLLSMPLRPLEIMIGKIVPYIFVGAIQAVIIIFAGHFIFRVPIEGSLFLLAIFSILFITANLAIGYTFSTLAMTQMQAFQMTFMFFLPNILLSGFMFPFKGMPNWAQSLGELLPLTHYTRIVRGILLKGAGFDTLYSDAIKLFLGTCVATLIAVLRFKKTLD